MKRAANNLPVNTASVPVVAIGASAGGLTPLMCFLNELPRRFGFALVFVQHLSAKHKSILPELIRTRWPDFHVADIADGMQIHSGVLYICPPGKDVRTPDGIFRITDSPKNHLHLAIDEFFTALAEDAGERATAVIFSGAGTDGARGAKAIRDFGGTVFVQDPDSAEFPSMPLAVMEAGQADAVLPAEEIAREIVKLLETRVGAEHFSASDFDSFYGLISQKTGNRFHHYKQSVVARRITRRMYLRGIPSLREYLDFITANDSEAAALAADLMIGVTSFFRDRLAWKALRLGVIRKLAAQEDTAPIRVWTPACSTGEEAYSVAMLLEDEFRLAGREREITVFATDLNERVVEKAREGIYPGSISADVPSEYLRTYFTSSEDGRSLIINKVIREKVVFARQDLLTDPPFSRLDLILCRNFLIYLEPNAQEKCISLFHYALKSDGYLFLGNAESVGRKALFRSLPHKKCRIYQKIEADTLMKRMSLTAPRPVGPQPSPPAKPILTEDYRLSVTFRVQEALLEGYAPAAVAITRDYDISYHSGPTNRYLSQPRGIPTQNLLELIPKGLHTRIKGAIYRATQEARPASVKADFRTGDGKKRSVSLRISRLDDNLILIVFLEHGIPSPQETPDLPSDAPTVDETALRQLEIELSTTRGELQNHIEQLRSLNEEMQSSNEELQAANEELETSREELQSLNEELITVNSQLQTKIEEQEEMNNDLGNFFASTNIPTIFLDHEFRVRRFTPAMSKLIRLIPADTGRPIVDILRESLGPDLIADARLVLETLVPVSREFSTEETWYVRTTLPYRTADSRIEGVVTTYSDITNRKRAEDAVRRAKDEWELTFDTVPDLIAILDCNHTVKRVNKAMADRLGLSPKQCIGLKCHEAVHGTTESPAFCPHTLTCFDSHEHIAEVHEPQLGGDFIVSTTPLFDDDGKLVGAVHVARDITERKRTEEALVESEQRVRHKLENLLSPEGDIGNLELGDIIDAPAIQSLMDKFYELTHIPLAVIDLKGTVLVGAGWQDICTKFHRVHPETCGYCIESDTLLTSGMPAGEYKLYKCKNNMWDVATPIGVGEKQLGHFFTGQFLFDDESPDYTFFRNQARQYGFDETEYLAALEKVPRLSRATVDSVMGFFMKLSAMISQLSYSNIKLARSLAERESLMASLRESETRLARAQEIAHLGSWELDLTKDELAWSDEVYRIFGLEPQEFGATYEAFLDRVHPDDRLAVNEAYAGSLRENRDSYEIEHRIVRADTGAIRWVHEKCEHFRDAGGTITRSVGMVHDITERKQSEDRIRNYLEKLHTNNEELTRFNNAMVDRELRMVELKKEVNALCGTAGMPERYRVDFEKEQS